MLALHANEVRIILEDDSEIDLVLIDCFPPPRVQRSDNGIAEHHAGMTAYRATVDALNAGPAWLRAYIPVPPFAREWFRNLKPGSKQAGFLWITPRLTLNEHLVGLGHASKTQPKPGSPFYDGESLSVD